MSVPKHNWLKGLIYRMDIKDLVCRNILNDLKK